MSADIDGVESEFSRVLFRHAQAEAARARQLAATAADHGVREAERTGVKDAISLAATAMQDWATWALLTTRVPLPPASPNDRHSLLAGWRRLPRVAHALGLPSDFTLTDEQDAFLRDLGAWHSSLGYDDPRAQRYLRERLRAQGRINGRQSLTPVICAALATTILSTAADLFDWAHTVTGLPTPTRRSTDATSPHSPADPDGRLSVVAPSDPQPAPGNRQKHDEHTAGNGETPNRREVAEPTVLVVDDLPGNRDLVCTVLGYHGYATRTASDGLAALQALRTEQPDLVLTDVWMPNINGYELARTIKADPTLRAIPIVFYTAHYLAAPDMLEAAAAGIGRIVTKTGDLEELLDAVDDVLQLAS